MFRISGLILPGITGILNVGLTVSQSTNHCCQCRQAPSGWALSLRLGTTFKSQRSWELRRELQALPDHVSGHKKCKYWQVSLRCSVENRGLGLNTYSTAIYFSKACDWGKDLI
jgi:hypothetical protein